MLEIALFGEPRFTAGGRPHSFVAPPKALPLLAYLLLHRNAPSARDSLAGLLWPESDEETARANLRRHLHYVRKALPPGEWLRIDGKSVQWNAEAPYRLDVAEFEQQSKIAQMRPLAAKLYAGDLYRACEEEWLYFERERLRNMQVGNLAALAQDAERARDHVAAASYAHALLELEPWREDAVRVLMRARMQTGDRGGALAVYERFSERLAQELDVEPMLETRELFEAFARKDDRAPAAIARAHTLVGRAGELETLLVQWRAAANGHGALALVGGEAGIGKTALLRALSEEVRAADGIVLTGSVAEGDAPFAAVVRALAQAQVEPKLRTASAGARALPPGLADTGERGAFFASVAAAVRSISEQSPVLLCIEDLHWAGGDTVALIEFLERRLRDARVLIACSYRDDGIAPEHPLRALRRIFATRATYAHVALNPLTPADADRIVRRRLGERAGDDIVKTLYRRTQGNAFFLTELLENVAVGEERDVPDSIRDLVEERSERLSPFARDLVVRFAVAGTTIAPDVLAAMLDGDQSLRGRALNELVESRFLREEPGAAGSAYAFNHDVVRESLYEGIASERRAELHGQIARTMEQVSATRYAAAIASHYERANQPQAAARAYLRAAAQAVGVFANEEAERYARKALALHADPDLAMEAYAHLDVVYHRMNDRARQTALVEEMHATAQRSGNPMHACQATYHAVAHAYFADDADAMGPLLQRLAAQIPEDRVWKARVHAFTSSYELLCGNPDGAWAQAQEALALCRAAGHAYGELFCYVLLLDICDGYTRPFDALLEEARALERSLGDPDSAFLLANAEAKLFLHVDRTQCRHAALRIVEVGERTGDQIYIGVGHMYLAAVATYRFEPDAAEQHFAIAFAALEESSRRADIARLLRFRGLFHYNIGDPQRGLADSLAALERAREARAHDLIAVSAGNTLYGYALTGRYEGAEDLAAQVLAELEGVRQHYFSIHHIMLTLGTVLCAQGRFDEAIPGMKRACEEHEVRGYKLHAAMAGIALSYALLRAGRAGEARPYIESYLNVLPEMLDEGWMPQEALWQVAQVLRALGEREQAQTLLTRAAQVVAGRLAALPREDQQQRFVALPVNREILRAHGEGVWPTF